LTADRDFSGRELGDFVLQEKIGQGGNGAVYRCYQPSLKRHAVVKVLWRDYGDLAKERFLREARLASRLDHPYAAHVYAFGAEDDGRLLWIAMELVPGITLAQWLKMRGPMPLDQFVPFFECVAEVVQAAHERGIVHRDLKPSNVMVIERGGRLFPKLLDFGIAKILPDVAAASLDGAPNEPGEVTSSLDVPTVGDGATLHRTCTDSPGKDENLTRSNARIGSRPYMSPEQWDDASAVGPATDIYSLGIVAYEALTGRVPFTAETAGEYHRLHAHATVPSLGTDFSTDVERVIRRALAKEPDARHPSAVELAADLRLAQRAQPHEQLRSLAQVWDDRARPRALLLKSNDLLHAPAGATGELERAFVAASQRYVARSARVRRVLAATAVALGLGAIWYRADLKTELAEQQTRSAERLTDVTITQAELEQGRSALLHGEPEAQVHLAEAYRRDPSPSTAFMLARALEPRLAEQARLESSFGRMWSAAFSPDGKQVVTTDDLGARLWDAETHRLWLALPHGDVVYQAVYSADGARLFTACGDGAVRIWNTQTGTLVRELRFGDAKPRYYVVGTTPDEKLVAAMEIDGTVAHVWDANTGAALVELRSEALGYSSLAFSADGRWLAASGGNDVRVFNTSTWARVVTVPGPGIYSLSWDKHDARLSTGTATGDVSIWSIPDGRRIHHLREIGEPVDAIAFAPDGRLVVAAARDGAEHVWDTRTGKLRSQGNYLRGKILSIEFDPTSTLVVAAGASGTVAIADAAQGMPVSMLEGPRNVVMAAHFDPSGQRVVGASWDGTARIWDAKPAYRRWSSPPISDECGIVTSLEPDQRFVAVGCIDHPTQVWDTAEGRLLAELPMVSQVDGDFASAYAAVSADGNRAAIARGNGVEVYELPAGKLLHTMMHSAAVNTVAFASSRRDVVTGAIDGSLLVSRDNGSRLALPSSPGGIDAAGFLPDGRVVAADAKRRMRIYDIAGTLLADREIRVRVRTLRMSADGRHLLLVPSFTGQAASPQLWDVAKYQAIADLADQDQGQVYAARFTPGGDILTACGDGAARLWDGATGRLRKVYHGGSRFLADVTLSADGTMLVGGGGDGMLRFWEAISARPLWTMPAHKSHLIGIRVEGEYVVTRGFSGDVSRWSFPDPQRALDACGGHVRCGIVSR
jgi:WD40 repeat protein/serine/threonine protein kinase